MAIIESHPPDTPLFLYCKLLIDAGTLSQVLSRAAVFAAADANDCLALPDAMHLLVSPLCAPPEYVERFAFIRERYDDPDHARQYVAAMTSLLDDIVGDVVAALRTAGLWENTLFVFTTDK